MELYEDLGVLFDESSKNTWFDNRWIATGSGTGLGTLPMTITFSQLVRKVGFYYYSESELTIRVTGAAGGTKILRVPPTMGWTFFGITGTGIRSVTLGGTGYGIRPPPWRYTNKKTASLAVYKLRKCVHVFINMFS